MNRSTSPLTFYSIVIIAVIISILGLKHRQSNIFAFDNYGYYLYLPAAFIQHDLSFNDIDKFKALNEKYHNTPTYYQLMQSPKGGIIIRMYMGMAILLSPAFFAGHGIALLTGMPADGFSAPYQWVVILFGLILTLAGLFVAQKLLLKFFSDKVAAVTLLITYIGTNLFFFSTRGNPIPHVYLFNLYIFLIWFTVKWHENPKWLSAVGIAVSLGLILAIRPSEIIAVFIPLLYNIYNLTSLKGKSNSIQKYFLQIILISFIVFLFILPQFLYWRIYAGEYIVSVYNDPGSKMDLSNPNFLNTLFSFRKGWFIYSPLSVLACIGIFASIKNQKQIFLFSLVFVLLNIYLISCFSSLISYGYRAFIQSYAILLLPLAVVIEFILNRRKWLVVFFSLAMAGLTYLNVLQARQLEMEIIDKSRMTKAAFFAVLGKWDPQKPESLMSINRTGYSIDTLRSTELYNKRVILDFDFENQDSSLRSRIDSANPCNGRYCLRMDSIYTYSPGIKIKIRDLQFEDHFWVRASVNFYSADSMVESTGNLVMAILYKQMIKYRSINLLTQRVRFSPGKWNMLTFDFISPEYIPDDAELQVYFWNQGKSTILIDDLKAELFTPKEE